MYAVTSNPWYGLQVRPRFEKQVHAVLSAKGFNSFLPLRVRNSRWSDRNKRTEIPLFPGYVFCQLDVENRLPILVTPGVQFIVGVGKQPSPIAEHEIAALQVVVQSQLDTQPCGYIAAGEKVRVEDGPLKGLEGLVTRCTNGRRVVVSISLLQRSVAVEIDTFRVSTISNAYC